jgi:hypothetical protein
MEGEEPNELATRWQISGPLDPSPRNAYSDRIEQLLQRAAELGKEANGARTEEERRTIDALASMCEGTARSFAHLQAFRAVLNDLNRKNIPIATEVADKRDGKEQ